MSKTKNTPETTADHLAHTLGIDDLHWLILTGRTTIGDYRRPNFPDVPSTLDRIHSELVNAGVAEVCDQDQFADIFTKRVQSECAHIGEQNAVKLARWFLSMNAWREGAEDDPNDPTCEPSLYDLEGLDPSEAQLEDLEHEAPAGVTIFDHEGRK